MLALRRQLTPPKIRLRQQRRRGRATEAASRVLQPDHRRRRQCQNIRNSGLDVCSEFLAWPSGRQMSSLSGWPAACRMTESDNHMQESQKSNVLRPPSPPVSRSIGHVIRPVPVAVGEGEKSRLPPEISFIGNSQTKSQSETEFHCHARRSARG